MPTLPFLFQLLARHTPPRPLVLPTPLPTLPPTLIPHPYPTPTTSTLLSKPNTPPSNVAAKPEDTAGSQDIDTLLADVRKNDERVYKLLLLGAGESGKSTLFKQAVSLYGKGVTNEDLRALITPIHNNIFFCMIALCNNVDKYAEIDASNQDAYHFFKSSSPTDDSLLTVEQFQYVKQLWADPAIRTCWDHRSEYQIYDCAEYFFNKIDELSHPNYMPTQQDHLRIRVRTTGIVETQFEIEGSQFKLCDVGGQRNERKKWIHCFDNVTAVIFVAAISEYDQVLFEDSQTNRLDEALILFEEIAGSRYFEKQSLILFLNKADLFIDKIARIPLHHFFPDYNGPQNSVAEAQDWIRKQFLERVPKGSSKEVFSHITTATSPDNVDKVFKDVQSTVINHALTEIGLK